MIVIGKLVGNSLPPRKQEDYQFPYVQVISDLFKIATFRIT